MFDIPVLPAMPNVAASAGTMPARVQYIALKLIR
jgi:hypothetical protein